MTDAQLPTPMEDDLVALESARARFDEVFAAEARRRWVALGARETDSLDVQRRTVTASRDDDDVWAALAWEADRQIELLVEIRRVERATTTSEPAQ